MIQTNIKVVESSSQDLSNGFHSSSLLVEKGSSLLSKLLLLLVFSLLSVNLLNQHTLCLVTVTLSEGVEVGVHVLVNLSSLTILAQQTTEHTNAAHPQQLLRNTSVHGTSALTVTRVVTTGLGIVTKVHTSTRVHQVVLLHDHSVLDQFANTLAGIGKSNIVDLAGVHPHLTLTALEHGSSKSLLKLQANHDLMSSTKIWLG